MSTVLRADNFDEINIKEKAVLDADAAAAATTILVQSVQNIAVDDFTFIGNRGSETTEIRKVTSISSLTLTIPALTQAHDRFEAIIVARADKIRYYRAANVDGSVPADGSFSQIAEVDIDYDQLFTDHIDSTGDSNFWYKYTFYNSVSTAETDLEATAAVRGGEFGHYITTNDVRAEAGLEDETNITDAAIAKHRDAAESCVNGSIISNYSLPLDEPFPALIVKISTIIAAGWLIQEQYGPQSPEIFTAGGSKVKDGKDLLKKIAARTLTITDFQGNSLLSTTGGVGGWPDETTKDATRDESGGDHKFRVKDKF